MNHLTFSDVIQPKGCAAPPRYQVEREMESQLLVTRRVTT